MPSASAAPTPRSSSASITTDGGLHAERLAALEAALGHHFGDPRRLARALTHASYAHEHPPALDQEPLAFVGDAALGLIVAEHLLARAPEAAVGVLTPERAALVSGANLARWAAGLGLGPLLRLGRGEDQSGGRERESILATTLEALLGIVYLEGGLDAVRRAIARLAGW
jgi:ribonuclease III